MVMIHYIIVCKKNTGIIDACRICTSDDFCTKFGSSHAGMFHPNHWVSGGSTGDKECPEAQGVGVWHHLYPFVCVTYVFVIIRPILYTKYCTVYMCTVVIHYRIMLDWVEDGPCPPLPSMKLIETGLFSIYFSVNNVSNWWFSWCWLIRTRCQEPSCSVEENHCGTTKMIIVCLVDGKLTNQRVDYFEPYPI